MSPRQLMTMMAALIAMTVGCTSRDEKLAKYAATSTAEQSQQNERMAALQQEVAAGARELVEAESQLRADFALLQRDMLSQSAEIARQRDHLETERKALAAERRSAPIVASAITATAQLIACLLPLLLGVYLLLPTNVDSQAQSLAETLIEELASASPRLSATPRIAVTSSTLPGAPV